MRGELGGREEVVCGVEKARKRGKSDPNHHLTSALPPFVVVENLKMQRHFKLGFATFFLVVSLLVITSLDTVL